MHDTPKRKKRLLNIFLIPLIGIVLIQGVLLLAMLFFSGVKSTIENNTVGTDAHILENRQMALQNTMIREWSSLNGESEDCTVAIERILSERNLTVKDFLSDSEMQEEFLRQMFDEMIATVQQKSISGGFLIMANDSPIEDAADYRGFFIRDSDPSRKTATNTDLLMERGSKDLARNASISLDNPWSRNFHFEGKGNRSADNFYYEPYSAGVAHLDTNMINLGYWATPFVLEDNYMDNHYMVTYSLPLIYDGTIYGVLGVEASLTCLEDYMDVRELDSDQNAGYILVKNQGNDTYQCIAGKGALYESVVRAGTFFTLSEQSIKGLYQVDGVTVGKQNIYALTAPMELYSNNVPYKNTQWELCALVTEKSIFEVGEKLYRGIISIIIGSACLGLLIVILMVRKAINPVYRLMDSVRGGVEGIREFVPSQITEIDELHDVVETVTEAQKKTEDQLIEEKERYRIAIESSEDMFFTYHKPEQRLEIVNTEEWDGIWDCSQRKEIHEHPYVHPLDRAQVENAFRNPDINVALEFRMRQRLDKDYEWYSLSAKVMYDETGKISMIVGYLHNINQQKEHELEEGRKKTTDPVTGFYRRDEGFRMIREMRSRKPEGVLFLLQIRSFRKLNERYGLTFGDLLLDQLSDELRTESEKEEIRDAVFVRAGSSEIGGWFPGKEEGQIQDLLKRVHIAFNQLIHNKMMQPDFVCGVVLADNVTGIQTLIDQAKISVVQARRKQIDMIRYEMLSEEEKTIELKWDFGEVVSMGYTEQMGLVSIALNLFERAGSTSEFLDLLAAKLQKRYTLKNLLITGYNRENLINSLEYSWNINEDTETEESMVQCREQDVVEADFTDEENIICAMDREIYQKPIFSRFLQSSSGIAVNMMDNGQYSGTIFFEGLSKELLADEAEKKELKEIATVIQNRINQERHDLSAQAKADFLARMSHEIRTPMNGIIGMTEIALKDGQPQERQIDCLQKIRGSSQYLLSLVNDILDMSKIESGKMQITEARTDLRKKLYSLHDLIESKLTEKHMHYTEKIDMVHSWFWADELRLSQVLVNILGNAVKYTDDGGHIRFEVTERISGRNISDENISDESVSAENTSEIYFAVTDDGVGISSEDQQLVFQSFEQARHQDGVYRQGTGLGLAISNRLVHMMGSSIQLESEPGKGSTFSFTLKLKWAEADEFTDTSNAEEVDLKGKRILVAEDNDLNKEIIQTILEDYGILVETAADGQIALDMMKASAPGYYDMILMDIMMPNMNGLESTRQIRKLDHPDSRTIPIVAMTANAFAEEQKQSIASGMNEHLSKPLNMDKLQEILKKYLL